MRTYLFTYCLSLLFAMGATPIIIELARRYGWVDQPNPRCLHREPFTRLGRMAIAHRLSTLKSCDRILYFDRRKLIDTGTFESLSQKYNKFDQMIKLSKI